MIRRLKIITILLLIMCLSASPGASDNGPRSLHFVAGVNSPVVSLSHAEARQLFMGTPVFREGTRLVPVLNTVDPLVMEIFLQKIIFMSMRDYERQLLSRVYRLGGERPPKISEITDLIRELQTNTGAVSYMWSDQIRSSEGIRSLGEIWSNSID